MSVSRRSSIGAGNRFTENFNKSVRALLLLLVGIYRTIGTNYFGGQCRFEPSCSEYAGEALRLHPPLKAVRLISVRLAKCRPGGACGSDPVPARGVTS